MRKPTKLFIVLLVGMAIIVAAVLAIRGPGGEDEEGITPPGTSVPEAGTLIFAFDHWSGTYLPIYVLKTIFEDELGYTVEITELSVTDAYEQVASGEVQMFTDGWFPVQDSIYDRYVDLVKLGQCYGGKARDASEGWLVPADFAGQYSLTHVEDLGDPQVANALDGKLIGAPEAWNASKCNDGVLEDYGLTGLYVQEHGSEEELMAMVEARLNQGKPTLFYLCLPNAYSDKLPAFDSLTWLEGTKERLPLSFVRAVVRSDFVVNHDKAARILSRYSIPGEDISWSMQQIAQKGESERFLTELAQTWIDQNREEVNIWLEGITGS